MSDENGIFLKSAQNEDVTYSNDGLLIAGQVVVRNVDGRFISGMTPDLCRILRLEARDHDDISVRVKRLTELLNEGRQAEAIFIASFSRWRSDTDGSNDLARANFDPAEARNHRGRWTNTNNQRDDTASFQDVQYRGYFHDIVVDDLIANLLASGGKAIKNVDVFGINGVLAIPDGAALAP